MPKKTPPKRRPKITDVERHERFLAMAQEVGASTKREDFEKAVMGVTAKKKTPIRRS